MSLVALLLTLAAVPAPMPGEAEAQRFQQAFERAEALYQQADYGLAISLFREADRQRVTPEVAWDLAKCFERLGDQAMAVYYYRLYVARAPTAADAAQVSERITTALARAQAQGLGFLELDAPPGTSVRVDGRSFPEAPVALFLAPGAYEAQALLGDQPRTVRVELSVGKATTARFEPLGPPLLTVEGTQPGALLVQQKVAPAAIAPSNGWRTAAFVTAGLGVALLAGGVTAGALSSADATAAQSHGLTWAQAQTYAGSANGKATAANVLLGVGGAVLAAGVVCFVVSLPEPGVSR